MTQAEFMNEIAFILDEDPNRLSGGRALDSISGFDSAGMLGLIAFFDGQLGVKINADALRAARTVDDLKAMAADKIE